MSFSPPVGSSWIEILPDGHQGTWRTLEAMRYLVQKDSDSHFLWVFLNSNLFAGLRGRGIVEALFSFARDRIRYVEDPPGLEKVSDFQRTTEAGYGDCDDKAVWLATVLYALNIPVRFIVQSYDGREWAHVYLEFYDWATWHWVALDPTADGHTGIVADIGWRQPLGSQGHEMRFFI